MLELDGSEGGGQLLRSALSLAMLANRAVKLRNVRGDRPTPGLRPQHVAAVELAAEVSDATVDGAEEGSDRLWFDPGTPTPGEYAIDVGTAGSATLVCETLIPLAAGIDGPLHVRVTGGTDVKWSPPADYLRRVKLPLLREYGIPASVAVDRRGFYPAGGGELKLTVAPGSVEEITLVNRGARDQATVHAVASDDLADADVAGRLCGTAADTLRTEGWSVTSRTTTIAAADSTGAALVIRLGFASSVAGVAKLGEPGVPAEQVATQAVRDGLAFERTGAAVDPWLADQLLLPLALGGGRIRMPRITEHVSASLPLLRAFGVDIERDDRTVRVPDAGTLITPG